MAQREEIGMSDVVSAKISSVKEGSKDYGAILSATSETAKEVLETALAMRRLTKKPVILIIGGD